MPQSESPLTPVFETAASAAAPAILVQDFSAEQVTDLRHAVRGHAGAVGLTGDDLFDFVVAVHELVINAVMHGGGCGRLRLRRDGDILICDVTDRGAGFADGVPAPFGLPASDSPGGRGILLASQLADTLQISDSPDGVTASVTVCLPAASTSTALPPALP